MRLASQVNSAAVLSPYADEAKTWPWLTFVPQAARPLLNDGSTMGLLLLVQMLLVLLVELLGRVELLGMVELVETVELLEIAEGDPVEMLGMIDVDEAVMVLLLETVPLSADEIAAHDGWIVRVLVTV